MNTAYMFTAVLSALVVVAAVLGKIAVDWGKLQQSLTDIKEWIKNVNDRLQALEGGKK